MRDILYRLNPWWEQEADLSFFPRPRYEGPLMQLLDAGGAVFVTGLRGVGKTALLKRMIRHLLERDKPEHILYLSFETYGLPSSSLKDTITQYRALHRIGLDRPVTLFLDDVSSWPDFHRELVALQAHSNVKVYASSSLTPPPGVLGHTSGGRTDIIEVLPLDFEEFLHFKKARIKVADFHILEDYFYEYMQTGGLPGYVLDPDITALSGLIDGILHRDIIALHRVRDGELVRAFFRLLMDRAGKGLSLNRVSKALNISVDSARRYLSYFERTGLVHTLERCGSRSGGRRTGKKVYAGDLGIFNLVTGFQQTEALLENLVFLKIKEKRPCYVYEKGIEIDFHFQETLLEVSPEKALEGKKKALFDGFPAEIKREIKGWNDYMAFFLYR